MTLHDLNHNNAISHCSTFCDVGKKFEIVKQIFC